MRAYILKKHGSPEVLRLSNQPEPQPGENEVRVAVQAIGINYADILSRKGLYGWVPKQPYIPGMEACGVIESVGVGVDPQRLGEKVIVGTQAGAYAEMVVVPQAQALPAVAGYSTTENAAFAVNYMTAWVGLFELARMHPGDVVLVHAAAGGVGTAAVQLAKQSGNTVYGTAGSDEKIELLKKLGVDLAVNYRRTDFVKAIREATGGAGVDVVCELVGGEVFRKSLELLKPFGRMVVMGFASLNLKKWNPFSWWRTWRDIPRAGVARMGIGSFGVMSSHLGYLLKDPETLQAVWERLTTFTHAHDIRPVIGAVLPFADMAAAHRLMESRRSSGKIVLKL